METLQLMIQKYAWKHTRTQIHTLRLTKKEMASVTMWTFNFICAEFQGGEMQKL